MYAIMRIGFALTCWHVVDGEVSFLSSHLYSGLLDDFR